MEKNHNYSTPEKGRNDWHVPLNENFDSLDTDVEIRDTEANRGNYVPKEGAKYLAIDTREVYIGDGEAWSHIGSLTVTPGDIYIQDTEPKDAKRGDLWIDTSSS